MYFRYERHTVFPKLLAANADDCFPTNMMFNADINKRGTARRFFCTALSDKVNSYSLEVSISGYQLPGANIFIPYNEESCILFLQAFIYYKFFFSYT